MGKPKEVPEKLGEVAGKSVERPRPRYGRLVLSIQACRSVGTSFDDFCKLLGEKKLKIGQNFTELENEKKNKSNNVKFTILSIIE